MKKILPILFIAAITNIASYAQQKTGAHTASKQEFSASFQELKTLIGQKKQEEVRKKWIDIHEAMLSKFAEEKAEISRASGTNDDAKKNLLLNTYKSQFAIYSEIIRYKDDILQNKVSFLDRLEQYLNTF